MTVDLATLVAIRRRMEEAAIPLLFHEVKTPERQANRIHRVMSWMGETGRAVTRDYVLSGEKPTDTRRRWKRGGFVNGA